jgi:hypothetical protein
MPSKEHTRSNDKESAKQWLAKPATENLAQRQTNPALIIQRAKLDPGSLTPGDMLQLQHMIGNQAVGRLLAQTAQHQPTQKMSLAQRRGQALIANESAHVMQQGGGAVQRQSDLEEKEPLRGKFATDVMPTQPQTTSAPGENRTGMPDRLKAGLERLSGLDMSGVRVRYNSAKPAQLNALAYTQGQEIEVGPGQERHLPHEGWHVVQQMKRRIKPTMQAKGVAISDDPALEREADLMGEIAAAKQSSDSLPASQGRSETNAAGLSSQSVGPTGEMPIMRKLGFEYELGGITPKKNTNWTRFFAPTWGQLKKGEVIDDKGDYQITADLAARGSNNLEFITRPFDEKDPGEVVTLGAVANSIRDDIREITGKPLTTNVPLNQFNRISGSSSIYIYLAESNPAGQIQMTGGVDPLKLSGLMSGEELGAIPEGRISQEASARVMPLQKYYRIGVDGPAMGLVYGIALNAVRKLFAGVSPGGQETLAAAGALMAQLVIEHRQKASDVSTRLEMESGRFIAKTDYAMLLQLIDERLGEKIEWARFPKVVLSAAQQLVDIDFMQEHEGVASLTLNSPVFPPYYGVTGGISFTDLTIGQWVGTALPKGRKKETEEVYESFGYSGHFVERETGRMVPVGRDLLTKEHYPGSTKQRNELGAYGAYGSKTDPGEKVILEWRDLYAVHPNFLPDVMVALFKYYSDIGFSGLYPSVKQYIPAYRRLVEDMPSGQHKQDAVKYFNAALYLFKRSTKETYREAQSSLSLAQKYFDKAHDEVIEERMERDRAARYHK